MANRAVLPALKDDILFHHLPSGVHTRLVEFRNLQTSQGIITNEYSISYQTKAAFVKFIFEAKINRLSLYKSPKLQIIPTVMEGFQR